MTQGAENDLTDIRFLEDSTPVIYFRGNEPFEDLNTNVLLVDAKAILARTTADTAQTDLATHIGQGGIAEHAAATTSSAGFMTAANKAKIDSIQAEAQLNILAPVDAIELVSRKATTLHTHPLSTTSLDGLMAIADKVKLNGIQSGAQVNNVTPAQATTLTSGGNADSLHGHGFSVGSEGFTAALHAVLDHENIPGVTGFPGFISGGFHKSNYIWNAGVDVFSHDYATTGLSTLECISAGYGDLVERGVWGAEPFIINNVSVVGTVGTVSFESADIGVGNDTAFRVWQTGWGTA